MRRVAAVFAVFFVLVLGVSALDVQLNFAAAGVTGTYYPLAIGFSNIIKKAYPEINITIETTGGGVENARLVGNGDNDTGLANTNYCTFAYQGKEPYKKAYKMYSVAYLYPTAMHFMVKENSSIKSIADFKGKKIAAGPAGGGTIEILRDMLPFYGLKESDLRISYLSFIDGSNALRDGNVDVNIMVAGPPASAAKELSQTAKIRFIAVEDEIIQKMYKEFGYYVPVTFPKSMFNTPEDVLTIGGGVQWIVRDGLSEDLVYKMTKAVFENLKDVYLIHPVAKYINHKDATLVSIPMHPGAEKYFKETGYLK